MNSYNRILNWLKNQVGSEFPNKKRLADELEVTSPSQLYETLNNKRVPKADVFLEWLHRLGARIILPNEFKKLEREFYPVPRVRARLASPQGQGLEIDDEREDLYAFQYKWLSNKCTPTDCVIMDIVGESMTPTLNDGDTVLVDQSQKDVWAGKLYAVGIEDTVVVKRLEKLPGKLVLRSDHPNYAPIHLDIQEYANFRIIGRVIWGSKEFK